MRTMNYFLEHYPPDSHSWAGKVTMSFGYAAHGWIQFAITCNAHVQGVIIHCSNVYDPFPDFIHWLNAIADDNLLAETKIDEEGKGKTFRATHISEDEFLLEVFELWWAAEKEGEERPIYMYAQVNKWQFLSEFLKQWDDFIANKYDPIHWEEYKTDLRQLDVSKVRAFVGE
jgi:hypothetical protein